MLYIGEKFVTVLSTIEVLSFINGIQQAYPVFQKCYFNVQSPASNFINRILYSCLSYFGPSQYGILCLNACGYKVLGCSVALLYSRNTLLFNTIANRTLYNSNVT